MYCGQIYIMQIKERKCFGNAALATSRDSLRFFQFKPGYVFAVIQFFQLLNRIDTTGGKEYKAGIMHFRQFSMYP